MARPDGAPVDAPPGGRRQGVTLGSGALGGVVPLVGAIE